MEIWRIPVLYYFACLKIIRINYGVSTNTHFHHIFTDHHVIIRMPPVNMKSMELDFTDHGARYYRSGRVPCLLLINGILQRILVLKLDSYLTPAVYTLSTVTPNCLIFRSLFWSGRGNIWSVDLLCFITNCSIVKQGIIAGEACSSTHSTPW